MCFLDEIHNMSRYIIFYTFNASESFMRREGVAVF